MLRAFGFPGKVIRGDRESPRAWILDCGLPGIFSAE